ncbi:hypothetical protein Ahy_A06g027633 isoform B [Arachis hypogaea]|uniref:Uncharacterized protein n=1 Tax=Arachis hypogaea TaxID=3818 RepID=A0A445CPA8_ARAHY|nr:hypothetical protein Ahy_A06g027633 isoform B [Arachis hypogaea]
MEYVSPEGLRLDGRRPMEMRQIRAEIGAVSRADGSAIFEMGNTKVVAAVYGPREVQNRSQQMSDQALIRCEYSMANFSTGDRKRKPKGDRRSTEISMVIRQTMEACIMTHLMPRSQIDIYVQVLQADGGTRSACINAATLALSDAGIPMCDLVTSCSAGYLNSTPLLDLNYVEDSAGGPDVTVGILPKLDKVTLLQMDSKLPIDILENVMQLATEGCKAVANYIREILLENTKQLEYRRGLMNKVAPKMSCINLASVMALLLCLVGLSHTKCDFEAIFNFGDSNSDTGGFYAAFPAESAPFGVTFFKKPAGRASDGRLMIDFLAQALGLPFLSPYLQSIGSNFRHGANYATLASTVLIPNTSLFVSGISPFSLAIQLNQMKQFKTRVLEFHQQEAKLPSPDIFGKSLYTFYIGQNDFTSNLGAIGVGGVKQSLPQVVSEIGATIKELYHDVGGRTFMVLNLAPVGCYPSFLVELQHNSSDIDEFGCMVSLNKAVVDYNKMLKETLRETRETLSDANVIYVDVHTVLLELFQHPTSHGLKYGTKACCGYGGGKYNFDPKAYCGNSKTKACDDPYNYVSWDGIHATEAANKLVTYAILNGSYSHPNFPLQEHCHLQPIG